jgi:SAM-dependent methyltransferase
MSRGFMRETFVAMACVGAGVGALLAVAPIARERGPVVDRLVAEAGAVRQLVVSDLARSFLDAAADLPEPGARMLYRHNTMREWIAAKSFDALPEGERADYAASEIAAARYYDTKYGTPIAYARAIDLVGSNGVDSFEGKRVLDFGYGTVGHLRMMASRGAEAVGVDVDSFLVALYSEAADQGEVVGSGGGRGFVRLLNGQWPGDTAVREAAGAGFDVIMSKNTLKRGYIHPEREVDPRLLVHLGVDDEAYVKAVFDSLKPGGLFMIYNLSPKPAAAEEPYKPWADGRCPFDRAVLEHAGFDVIEFDRDDSAAARAMGAALRWGDGEGAMDLENDLFARFTIARRPR